MYLYLVGGRLLYETLHANLKGSLPSITTLSRLISSSSLIEEGRFRFAELAQFLQERNLRPVVWISEDATKIVSKIQYYSKLNKNVGFVLLLDKNGLPIMDAFKVNSFKIKLICIKLIITFFRQHQLTKLKGNLKKKK